MLSQEFHSHANSNALQEKHKDIYAALYRACPTVVSAPVTLRWSPNYAVGPGGIGIISKLPLRVHVGIEPKSSSGIEWGPVKYYIPEQDSFRDWENTRFGPIFFQILEKIAKNYNKSNGARIWVVCEIPWYRGWNVDPLVAAAVASAWLLYLNAVSAQELEEMAALSSDQLLTSPVFDKVFRLAWKLDSIVANWLSDADLTFATLIDSRSPVVFFREKDPVLFDHYRDFGIDHPSSYYNLSDGLFFRGMRMDELLQINPDQDWPIDIAIIFTGEEGDSRFTYQSRGAFKAKLDEAAAFTEKTFNGAVPETFRQTPKFLEMCTDSPSQSAGMNLFQIYRNSSVVHSLTVLKNMHDLFQYGATSHILREFLHNQNSCQDILRTLGLSPFTISYPRTVLQSTSRHHTDNGFASRLIGPGDHGCLMAMAPLHTLEGILNEALPKIKAETQKTVHCHYASWCDGNHVYKGVRVEQQVETGKYSNFTGAQSVTVREWSSDGNGHAVLYTTEKWNEECGKFDLVLDARQGKVLVNGQNLTSTQIHSAKQTIELFKQFFLKNVAELGAGDLSDSCYRSDRNQMESKIVRPLIAAVKELTGKPLGLEIHGGLGSNFKVQFNPSKNLRVGFVEKV